MRERSPQGGGLGAALREKPAEPRSLIEQSHQLEHTVRRELLSRDDLQFSTLVVRRVPGGVCLEGVLEAEPDSPDVCSLVQAICGVDQVLNHLVTRRPARLPAKG
jgi:hypothetical protein